MDAPARARRARNSRTRARDGRDADADDAARTTIPRDDARRERARGRKIVMRNLPATLDARRARAQRCWTGWVRRRSTRRSSGGSTRRGRREGRTGGTTTTTTTRRATTPSRFYATVRRGETVKALRERYDGATFRVRARDEEGRAIEGGGGEETRARVEYAPSQWTPREFGERYATAGETAPAENALEGTIEEDEDYLKFLGALEAKKKANGATTGAATPKNAESAPRKSTALLEFLWRQRAAAEREKGAGKKSSKKSSKKSGKASQSKTGAKTAAPAAPKTESKKKKKTKTPKPKQTAAPNPSARANESKKTPEIKIIKRASMPVPKAIS